MSKLEIRTKNRKFATAKDLYGIFFEDINRAGDSGLYPEMIRNRSFEDSILPEGYHQEADGVHVTTDSGWLDEFCHGEGLERWVKENRIAETMIPGWYEQGAVMELEREDTLNDKRQAALRVSFSKGSCIYNTGYCGIAVTKGENYPLYLFAKADKPVTLEIGMETEEEATEGSVSENGSRGTKQCLGACTLTIDGQEYTRYDLLLTATQTCTKGRLVIRAKEEGQILLGFISLMPGDTYKGHGLRKDLVEKLADLHPRFMRFPGGCIVEGTTPSTVMKFANTVGPVWERPGHQLVWHYRTSLGLGFHEYLQLCEDLDMEPMYVCNCGMTCQGRNCVLLEGDALQETLEDTLNAIEYAIGPKESKWGKLRADMGHPEPFKMTYLEIGNENWGPDYEKRYQWFYQQIKARYPEIKTIANAHVEENGCPAECVDEHFYNTLEFFAENMHYYDHYDRQGPKIFVGEQAVNEGEGMGKLYGALGEAAFLIGLEQNQDIVTLASYAPLFENVNYAAWFPNLIRFNNHQSLGIPTYYVWKMFGQNRGEYLVDSVEETGLVYRPLKGMAALKSQKPLRFRNATWNGTDTRVTRELMGHVQTNEDGYLLEVPDGEQREEFHKILNWADDSKSLIVFGEEDETYGRFEADIYVEENCSFELGAFSARVIRSYYDQLLVATAGVEKDWYAALVRPFLWKIEGNHCSFEEFGFLQDKKLTEDFTISLTPGTYHRFGYETDGKYIRLLLDGAVQKEISIPASPSFASVTTDTEDSVIIKAVNLLGEPDPVAISLDCDVESDYDLTLLTGRKEDYNSFEETEKVHDITLRKQGAGREFIYEAPAYSVSVLKLQKR